MDHEDGDGTTREKVTRGAPDWASRGAGPCATDCHATGKKIAVAQVSLCAMGIYIAVAHQGAPRVCLYTRGAPRIDAPRLSAHTSGACRFGAPRL